MPRQPPSLTAYLCRRTDDALEHQRARFHELAGAPPTLSLTTGSWVAHVLMSPAPALADAGPVSVVVHGEAYGTGDPGLAVASGWPDRQGSVVRDLPGSYALLVADRACDELAIVTDRLASRRLFCSEVDGGTLVSSALAPHRRLRRRPDLIGVASYLVNGRAYAGRTVLDGVRLLERASIHRLGDRGLSATSYWDARFEPSTAPEDELQAELSDRLAAAVDRCLFDRPTPFLALSGGMDSRGIGAELRWSAGVDDVECFSFVRGEPRAGHDEEIAAEIAGLLGYPHRLVQSYDDDLVGLVLDNALQGEGNTNVVHEVAGWKAMGEHLDAVDRPVVLTGDTAFGWDEVPLHAPHDVLDAVHIHGVDAAPDLARVLAGATYRGMADGLEADRDAIWSRCADTDDVQEAADFLNLDQRLPHVILPWREAFPERSVAVRRPLLDNELLDFVTILPAELRIARRLYLRTLEASYPELARLPLARNQNFRMDHTTEVPRHARALRRLIESQSSVVDDLVPPDVAHQLLRAAIQRSRWRASPRRAARRLVPGPLQSRVRSQFPRPAVRPVPPSLLVLRLLILRAALPS